MTFLDTFLGRNGLHSLAHLLHTQPGWELLLLTANNREGEEKLEIYIYICRYICIYI